MKLCGAENEKLNEKRVRDLNTSGQISVVQTLA